MIKWGNFLIAQNTIQKICLKFSDLQAGLKTMTVTNSHKYSETAL